MPVWAFSSVEKGAAWIFEPPQIVLSAQSGAAAFARLPKLPPGFLSGGTPPKSSQKDVWPLSPLEGLKGVALLFLCLSVYLLVDDFPLFTDVIVTRNIPARSANAFTLRSAQASSVANFILSIPIWCTLLFLLAFAWSYDNACKC